MTVAAREDHHIVEVESQSALAVLDLVVERPTYAYEIGRTFELRYGHLLTRSEKTIRRTLRKLCAMGLIEPHESDELGPNSGIPRRYYRATALGARSFRVWRDEIASVTAAEIAQRLAAARGDARVQLHILDQYERACAEALRQLRPPASSATVDVHLMVEHYRQKHTAALQWAAYARATVRAGS